MSKTNDTKDGGPNAEAGDNAAKHDVSELVTLWDEVSIGRQYLKGLEYLSSPDSNRILFMHTGCCGSLGQSILKDRSMQKIYRVKGSSKCCSGSLLGTIQDFRQKEILRFEKEKDERLVVTYRKEEKIGVVIFNNSSSDLTDSYLLYTIEDSDGEELCKVFSTFDEVNSCASSSDVTSYVLQNRFPYELASFQHSTKGILAPCCGPRGSSIRENSFRLDFHENTDPLVKCLVLAAAYWRFREGFRRCKNEENNNM